MFDTVHKLGQDGGLVSAILIWCLENKIIDGALVSYLEGDGTSWKAIPGVATNRDEVLQGAGSRYTYSANTLALPMAIERGLENLALVGMSCQSSVPPVMWSRKVGKIGKPIKLNIGLLCSKTFDDSIFEELFLTKYGLHRTDIVKVNVKGRVPDLDAQRRLPRDPAEGMSRVDARAATCAPTSRPSTPTSRPAASASSTTGRSPSCAPSSVERSCSRWSQEGVIETRPGDDDPGAIALLHKLAKKSRERWPAWAAPTRASVCPRRRKVSRVVVRRRSGRSVWDRPRGGRRDRGGGP